MIIWKGNIKTSLPQKKAKKKKKKKKNWKKKKKNYTTKKKEKKKKKKEKNLASKYHYIVYAQIKQALSNYCIKHLVSTEVKLLEDNQIIYHNHQCMENTQKFT